MTAIPTFSAAADLTAIGAPPADDTPKAPDRIEGVGRDPRTVRRAERRRMIRLEREGKAAAHIERLPEPGEDIVLILTGVYHGWDIVEAILQLAGGATVAECYLATLGFNRTQTRHLADLLDSGRIGRLTFVVSEMFAQKNATEYDFMAEMIQGRGHRLANTRNHAKLMLFRLSDGRHIVTHGSLNLRRCNSFEQLVITQDADLYRFFAAFLEEVIAGEVAA